ncbi:hypothetical protein GY21_05750 [Cryobacterium roopkundense]|uniref:Uncharacterized protein n=1 Tax=Cryobacterium roopkundense TaxID=1001240 RepID=A0A099JNT8_9MICO|nr:hypothetical protein [Cryobacterium roopkundense]KGJ79292.1 hypothetical protein GY21_05750 [Cryobacterium roopkundense]MBB5643657.1 hypothetical protein [Cryobacterium roopkundense]
MRYLKLAVTTYGHDRSRPTIGADDIWINLDQVVSIEEQLDSNTFTDAVREGIAPEEHYPCAELTTSNGSTHLVSLGVYPTQAAGFAALTRFMPLLLQGGTDADTRLEELLAAAPSGRPFRP